MPTNTQCRHYVHTSREAHLYSPRALDSTKYGLRMWGTCNTRYPSFSSANTPSYDTKQVTRHTISFRQPAARMERANTAASITNLTKLSNIPSFKDCMCVCTIRLKCNCVRTCASVWSCGICVHITTFFFG